jgi:AcrR family transcriptional regulator
MRAVDRRETIERAATDVFAERGYRGASIDEIARRSGVTPPVVYDHFASKRDLYERLLERHYAALRDIWFRSAATGDDIGVWIAPAVDAWFAYVEANRSAAKMLFREPTTDPQIADVHGNVVDASRSEMLTLVQSEAVTAGVDDDATWMDLTWEVLRGVLQGLALWWYDHPEVPRERIVQAAMNGMWLGFERVLDGERWQQ